MTKIKGMNGLSNPWNGKIISTSSLQAREEPARRGKTLAPLRRLLDNYIFENSSVIFAAKRGAGKTLLGLPLCIAIAAEWPSLFNEPIDYHGNTLFINCELSEDTISRRLSRLFEETPRAITFPNYHLLAGLGWNQSLCF